MTRSIKACAFVFAGVIILAATASEAVLVSSAGVTALASKPSGGIVPGAQEPTLSPIVFAEVVGGLTSSPLAVDQIAAPITPAVTPLAGPVVNASLTAGFVPAGVAYDSFIFHFDPLDADFLNSSYNASLTFSRPILGLQFFSSSAALQASGGGAYSGALEAGDAEAASNGGYVLGEYPMGVASRGLESGDAIGLSADLKTLIIAGVSFGSEIDQVRILVAAVPEPSTLLFSTLIATQFLASTRRTRGHE